MATRKSKQETNASTEGDDGAVIDERGRVLMPTPGWRDAIGAEDPPEEESPVDRVLALLSGASSVDRVKVKVYRRVPNAPDEWCADYGPEEFEDGGLPMIRSQWGAGAFQIRVYGPHPETGRMGLLGREQINIAAAPTGNPAPAVAAAPQSDPVLSALLEGQRALLEAISKRPDPMAQIKEMALIMGVMREAMGGASHAGAPSLLSQLKELRELQAFAKDLKGDDDKESDMDRLLKVATPLVETIAGAVKGRGGSAEVPALVAPPSIAAAPISNDNERPMTMDELKQALAQILLLAKGNASIEEAAEFIADRIPDEVADLMATPVWFTLLCGVEPAVKEHEIWLTKVRDRALQLLEEDDGDGTAPAAGLPAG